MDQPFNWQQDDKYGKDMMFMECLTDAVIIANDEMFDIIVVVIEEEGPYICIMEEGVGVIEAVFCGTPGNPVHKRGDEI